MTAIAEPIAVALLVADALEAQGLRYTVGGSLASSMSSEPRSTLDVDVVVAIEEVDVAALVAQRRHAPAHFPRLELLGRSKRRASTRPPIASTTMTPMIISKSPTMTRPFVQYHADEQAYADRDKNQTAPDGVRGLSA